MNRKLAIALGLAAAIALTAQPPTTQQRTSAAADNAADAAEAQPRQTNASMKTIARGTEYAAASMTPQSTMTAERTLRAGGNAFDAIVAGQAVLGLTQPNMNGIGGDAVLLV